MKCFRDYSVFYACLLMLILTSVPMYWGNLSVYTFSYYKVVLGRYVDPNAPWIISLYSVSWAVTVFSVSFFGRKLQTKTTIVFSIVIIMSASTWLLSIAAVTIVPIPLEITLGLLNGIAVGFAIQAAFRFIGRSMKNRAGFAIAILRNCRTIGSICVAEFVTAYLNPENEVAEGKDGSLIYFTNPEVRRLPWCFAIIGGSTLILQLIGLSMIKIGDCVKENETLPLMEGENDEKSTSVAYTADNESTSLRTGNTENDVIPDNDERQPGRGNVSKRSLHSLDGSEKDWTLKQILKSATFVSLQISFLGVDVTSITILNFYKIFGQITFTNDHFLTTVGSGMLVGSIIFYTIMGVLFDRLDLKTCYICLTSALAVLSYFYYFSPCFGIWMFGITSTIYFSLASVGYMATNVVMLRSFGETHHVTLYGVVTSLAVPVVTSWPVIAKTLIDNFSLFAVFAFLGVLHTISTILNIVYLNPGSS